MTARLKDGDLCLVVRDLLVPEGEACHGSMIGTPVTLVELELVTSLRFQTAMWRVAGRPACPRCRSAVDLFAEGELQRLRGPSVDESITETRDEEISA